MSTKEPTRRNVLTSLIEREGMAEAFAAEGYDADAAMETLKKMLASINAPKAETESSRANRRFAKALADAMADGQVVGTRWAIDTIPMIITVPKATAVFRKGVEMGLFQAHMLTRNVDGLGSRGGNVYALASSSPVWPDAE